MLFKSIKRTRLLKWGERREGVLPRIGHCKKSLLSVLVGLGRHNEVRQELSPSRGMFMEAGFGMIAKDVVRRGICLLNWTQVVRESCEQLQDGLVILNTKARGALDPWTSSLLHPHSLPISWT